MPFLNANPGCVVSVIFLSEQSHFAKSIKFIHAIVVLFFLWKHPGARVHKIR